ncbi:tyrosine-type recombinase/integrase [Dyadobacter crusticola]|uniref:tyrosine-type recombinase/integrase n=1 Tax=Dyadobacter crusticola TaxID=292407 RepID=UPI0004E0CA0E|nr:tyrosine-type recombinase/integrase [Dyadobacter crusticola]
MTEIPKKISGTILGQFLAGKYGLFFSPEKIFPFEPAELQRPKKAPWYVSFYVFSIKEGKLKRRKKIIAGESQKERKEAARIVIDEINTVLKAGAHIDPIKEFRETDEMPLIVAMGEFMKEKRRTLKEQSVKTYEKWSNYFSMFMEEYELTDLNLKDFGTEHASDMRKHALETLNMGNKAYNNYKAFVSGFFIYSAPTYKLTSNPIKDTLSSLPTKTSKHIAYSTAQVSEYKATCEELGLPELWFFVRMIYYTFCRPWEEVRKMQVSDIKDDHIFIYADTSKTNHRTVMIPPALEAIFKEWNVRDYPPTFYIFSHGYKPGKTLVSHNFFYDKHIKVLKKMELAGQGYDIYGWKHTGVIALYKATKDLMLVKEQCGHSDISQTVQYLRDLGVFHYATGINLFPEI